MEREELSGWLRLHLTPGVGNLTARKLLTAFGLPEQIFEQSELALTQVVSASQAAAVCAEPPGWQALLETTWNWLEAEPDQRRVLTLGDVSFPQSLLQLEDPPLLLYAMGQPQAWENKLLASGARHSLAMVGSRNPTPQGLGNARQFAKALAEGGLTIVSGMALGVDGAAHEGALEGAAPHQMATIAVVGTGLDRVYPKEHRDLAHRIAQRGLLISEYGLGTPPTATNFPRRNRILAGLSCGTLVVEAALKSGSLITARLALEQGKDVFAIPGSIHAPQSRGCHALIKQGAKLVESAQDVLEELAWPQTSAGAIDSGADYAIAARLECTFPEENTLLQALGFEPTGLDALLARTGLDTPTLQGQLMQLELEGSVMRLPGGLFQRLAQA
jgi:DNA processing protein